MYISFILIKVLNRALHCGKHGGLWHTKFSTIERIIISALLWRHAKKHPLSRLGEYQRIIEEETELHISLSEISKVFKSWNWSFKKPHRSMFIHLFALCDVHINNLFRTIQQIQACQFSVLWWISLFHTIYSVGKT